MVPERILESPREGSFAAVISSQIADVLVTQAACNSTHRRMRAVAFSVGYQCSFNVFRGLPIKFGNRVNRWIGRLVASNFMTASALRHVGLCRIPLGKRSSRSKYQRPHSRDRQACNSIHFHCLFQNSLKAKFRKNHRLRLEICRFTGFFTDSNGAVSAASSRRTTIRSECVIIPYTRELFRQRHSSKL